MEPTFDPSPHWPTIRPGSEDFPDLDAAGIRSFKMPSSDPSGQSDPGKCRVPPRRSAPPDRRCGIWVRYPRLGSEAAGRRIPDAGIRR
ncbi:MAG: hypothetical protein CMJ27_13700 [Phycisphaerae bacterium]|nr:hypothetical protein [Phycisphaerae bacterium]OUW99880.1 MAG: hypothetical protein CBD91_07965 [Phycisphaeraceae bacterium TMED231]